MSENNRDLYSHTEVESAIIQGDPERFHEVIDSIDITHRSDNDSNLLHKAATAGEADIAAELIKRGVDMDAVDYEDKTPLHRALEKEHDEVARVLIDNGCRLDIPDEYGAQPLVRAVQSANIELVELLVENGADPYHETNGGLSPHELAEQYGIEGLIEALESESGS